MPGCLACKKSSHIRLKCLPHPKRVHTRSIIKVVIECEKQNPSTKDNTCHALPCWRAVKQCSRGQAGFCDRASTSTPGHSRVEPPTQSSWRGWCDDLCFLQHLVLCLVECGHTVLLTSSHKRCTTYDLHHVIPGFLALLTTTPAIRLTVPCSAYALRSIEGAVRTNKKPCGRISPNYSTCRKVVRENIYRNGDELRFTTVNGCQRRKVCWPLQKRETTFSAGGITVQSR